jgi:ubiquinone/menaquinone biosynthesis C-methylase UbiE
MQIPQGLITVNNYEKLIKSDFFKEIEKYSNAFLENNKDILKNYSRRWVLDSFHQWSRQYEYPFVYHYAKEQIERLPAEDKVRILDAGSGLSFLPYLISKRHKNAIIETYDYDERWKNVFREINKKEKKDIQFTQGDIRKTPFPSDNFNIIYCISVLEHTNNYEEIMQEFSRILKPNGKFILTFDIAFDGLSEISTEKVSDFLKTLGKYFNMGTIPHSIENSETTATNIYISKKYGKKLLPWKHPRLKFAYDLIKNKKIPKTLSKNLGFYCIELTKK